MNQRAKSLSRTAFMLALVCACLGGVTARAQEPTPTAVAVAREVVITKGATVMADPLVRGVIETVKNNFVPTNPQLIRELNEVAQALQKEFEGKRDEVIDGFARAYARRFTEQELKDLLLFYKTPLGQKFSKEEPEAIQDGLRTAQDWGETFSDTVMSRMRSDMAKKGHPL